jgi:hypothetical protein
VACCGLLPLGLFLFFGPMMAAGRGVRPYLICLGSAWGLVLLLGIASWPDLLAALADWHNNGAAFIGLGSALAMSAGMGALVLWVRKVEERSPDRTRCRRCGYDLRATPQRCPECGTPVRPERETV